MSDLSVERPKVRLEFQLPDGRTAQRSQLDDFRTVRVRIIERIRSVVTEDVGNRVLMPGINAYNCGEYENALESLIAAGKQLPVLADELALHIRVCKRVTSVSSSEDDRSYLQSMAAWRAKPRIFRVLLNTPTPKIRCKHCGHFTPYILQQHARINRRHTISFNSFENPMISPVIPPRRLWK